MQKSQYKIFINAPKEKVWHTMLDKETYTDWTKVFSPDSTPTPYRGSWDQGSKIVFAGPGEDGKGEMGMVARIKENRPYEFLSIEHYGILKDGKEITEGPEVDAWIPAYENYTFNEKDGGTEVVVDMDQADEYKEMFDEMWPKALERLKELAEV